METLLILFIALLPVGILLFYINHKDKYMPEPTGWLVKAFFYGVLSVFVSLTISIPLGMMGFFTDYPQTIMDSIRLSFLGAAIPEECAKLFMLWLLLRKNPHFDEKMDGIVYAAFVSLGFAGLENIMYLFDNYYAYIEVGISRAIFSIPGHFCFGVLMGYYYSLAKFSLDNVQKNRAFALLIPILVHGIYDAILFVSDVSPILSGILSIVFYIFCYKMWKYCSQRIKEHVGSGQVF